MKATRITAITLLFLIIPIFGATINGYVYDSETGKPLVGANIIVEGTGYGAASNSKGLFETDDIPPGTYDLTISVQGYGTREFSEVSLIEGEKVELNVAMLSTAIKGKEVVVLSTRRPMQLKEVPDVVLNISKRDIDARMPSDISDVISYAPGVNVEGGTGSGQPFKKIISIDGLPSQYSLVMMNGARVVSSHWHTGANVNIIPPEAVERIEVLKGAASAQYGSDGLGGALNILTKRGTDDSEMLFTTYGGSRRLLNSSLLVRGPVNEAVHYSVFSGYEQSDGDSILLPAHRVGEFNYDKFTLLGHIDGDIAEKIGLNTQMFYLNSHNNFFGNEYESWLITPKVVLTYDPVDDLI